MENKTLESLKGTNQNGKGKVGKLSFSVEELRKSAFYIKKLENAKATIKKYPVSRDLFKDE